MKPASSRWPPTNRRGSTSPFLRSSGRGRPLGQWLYYQLPDGLAIVVGVLLVFMGYAAGSLSPCRWRSTFSAPCLSCISGDRVTADLPRALIIALSMLVDNAIVIVEGVLIARQQGSPLLGAINYVIRRSALPLLGATIIAILAFAPIGLSQDSTGSIANPCSGAADLADAKLVLRPDHHAGTH